MKVTLERSHLLKSLAHVHRVVERRNTIPILSNILLRAQSGSLHLKATDLDIEVAEAMPAAVEVEGTTTVPAHTLYDIVRKLSDGAEVSLDASGDQGQMALTSGRSRFSIQVLPSDDFPNLNIGEFSHQFSIAAPVIKDLIDRTQFAISTEETRYYLNGIFLHTLSSDQGTRLRAVATDGHRLAQAEAAAPVGSEGMPSIIFPRKAVAELQKLVDGADVDVNFEVSETKVRISIGSVVLVSKLIEGTFPDYERVIPQGNDKALVVDRGLFAQAVDRVSTIASERGRAVKLALSAGKLDLTVTNPDSGVATEELAAEFDGEPLEIGFNARYLLDIAAQIRSESAVFLFHDSGSPTLVREEGTTDALYVLMPMRV